MHVLLIEDDGVIQRELLLRWKPRGWTIDACGTLHEADLALARASANLVVLDLGLPDGDGLQWLARLRRADRTTPVLVLTARDRVVDRVEGLRTGADDYLVKPFAVEELDARIDVLTRRGQRAREDVLRYGPLTWFGSEGRSEVSGQPLELFPREFEVLGLLMRRAPRLVPKRELVDALAERNMEVSESAVEVYVSRLRRKLMGTGTAIRTQRGFGYILEKDPTP